LPAPKTPDVVVRALREEDLGEADRIIRLAFGTFLRAPDPLLVFGDRQTIANRWRMNPSGILGAYLDGKVVGSNVATKWGTFGWFGPLSVRPDLWDKGIAKELMGPTMDLFSEWQTTRQELFTFAESPKHVGLYQKFGFHARFLTAIMTKKVHQQKRSRKGPAQFLTFSSLSSKKERELTLRECRELTESVDGGLDVSDEIKAVQDLRLGDTVLVRDGSRLASFAVCHVGAETEAGSGGCFIKFGMAVSKADAGAAFRRLLTACEDFASRSGAVTIEAGVNLGRSEAYRGMLSYGFRTEFQGVAMQRPNRAGLNRPDVFAIYDLR
jgi:GNAT superfamily N-acetyltransferase